MSDLVLSLFPGLELLDRAFRAEGFCVVAGPDRLLGGDVRDFHAPAGVFDGVIGGSPCQSFSSLANLVRQKVLDERGWGMARRIEGRQWIVTDGKADLFAGTSLECTLWLGVGPGNLVTEFERVVEEAAAAWFLHENTPRAPIPRPAGYAVQDFQICNSSIPGEDGLGQEQERVRRFTYGVRGPGPAPCLLRWIPRAALRLPAQLRSGAVLLEPVRNSPEAKGRVRVNGIVRTEAPGQRRATKEVLAERSQLVNFATVAAHALNGSAAEIPDDFTTVSPTGKAMRFRRSAVLADPGSENRRERQPAITGAHTCERRPKGGHGERRTLGEMLRLQGLPEDLLDDQPFTAKAARKMVANGVPMPLGLAVARAVRMALGSIDPDLELLTWRDDEVSEMIRRVA